jgi:signal transduction histidine kinase
VLDPHDLLSGLRGGEVAFALALVVAALCEVLLRGLEPRLPLLILAVLTPLPLARRVRFPLEVLGVSTAALILGGLVAHRDDYPVALGCAAVVAVYSAAAHLRGRRAETADTVVITAIVGSAAVAASKNWGGSAAANVVAALVSLTILLRGAWIVGRSMQRRRDRVQATIAAREEQAQTLLREERARIARELHDVVAHSMSVIVLQARGARHALGERPAEARDALSAVERTAAQALTEMRRLLGVLREGEDAASLAPQSSLGQIDGLLADLRTAGLDVEFRREGLARELPPGIDLCAYRVVQEALTNTLKHSGANHASVVVRYGVEGVEIEVRDQGTGLCNGSNPGQGLLGLRERVAILGGELQAGAGPEQGYLVRVWLPL